MKKNILIALIMHLPLASLSQMDNIHSKLEIFHIYTDQRETLYEAEAHFEAPNWSRDSTYLLFNQEGRLIRFDIATKKRRTIDTGFADRLNNDHGISPDGTLLAISHHDEEGVAEEDRSNGTSRIYTVPIDGGVPVQVTDKTPSYWHGWSPDGKTLLYTAQRNGNFDIYAIPVDGGTEIRLTEDPGLDDGPEYSPDGRTIYYNAISSGSMELWRMDADGENKTQLTDDAYSNWFPHPSPDGRYIVFISYLEDQGSAHPAMKRVALRLLDLNDDSIRVLCKFTGGQGTINVPSWSPDGKKFAFVSYEKR